MPSPPPRAAPPSLAPAFLLPATIIALIPVLVCVLIVWPGFISNDSVQRHWMAASIADAGVSSPVRVPRIVFDHIFPPLFAVAIATMKMLTGTWGATTVLQVALFSTLGGVLAMSLLGRAVGIAAWCMMLFVPPVWNHGFAMLPDVWVATALIAMALFLFVAWPDRSWSRVLRCAGLFAAAFVGCGFRFNTPTILPLVLVGCFLAPGMVGLSRRYRSSCAMAVVLGAAAGIAMVVIVPFRACDPAGPFFAWEHVGMLKLNTAPEVQAKHTLDEVVGKPGATDAAIKLHVWISGNSINFGPDAPAPSGLLRQPEFGARVRQAHKRLATEHPMLYARMKLQTWKSLFGLRRGEGLLWIGPDVPAWEATNRTELSPPASLVQRRAALNSWGERARQATNLLWMPCTLLIAAAVSLVAWLSMRKPKFRGTLSEPAVWCLGLGVCYYGAFFLIAPGYEWRYFFPAFVIGWIGVAVLLADILRSRYPRRSHTA
jgi:hypothetical protein